MHVTSGISQESLLGPVLFVLYINDLPDAVLSDIYLFAGDTKTSQTISNPQDRHLPQQDLDRLMKWSNKWLLRFHPEKCKSMRIGYSTEESVNYTLEIDGARKDLSTTHAEQDIRVLFDPTFKHIKEKINKATSIFALFRRAYMYLDQETFYHSPNLW
ncbi:uncharacterized protein LOC144433001 [Glandiceps talaboti]